MYKLILYLIYFSLVLLVSACSSTNYFTKQDLPTTQKTVAGVSLNDFSNVEFDETEGIIYLNEGQVDGKLMNGDSISKKLKANDEIVYNDDSKIKLGRNGDFNFKSSDEYPYLYSSSIDRPIKRIVLYENDKKNEYHFEKPGAKGINFDWHVSGSVMKNETLDFKLAEIGFLFSDSFSTVGTSILFGGIFLVAIVFVLILAATGMTGPG